MVLKMQACWQSAKRASRTIYTAVKSQQLAVVIGVRQADSGDDFSLTETGTKILLIGFLVSLTKMFELQYNYNTYLFYPNFLLYFFYFIPFII